MTMTHREAQTTIQSARNRALGKPLQRNTRLYGEPGKDFQIKFHNTIIVTIHTDGTYSLCNGGYRTVTTLERIRTYAPVSWQTLQSEGGDWFVAMKPVARDPRPANVERSIPRPFEAANPGDEPVKAMTGCKAGQMVTTEHVDELVETRRSDMKDSDELVEVVRESSIDLDGPGGWDTVKVKRSWNDHIFYTEDRYWSEEWAAMTGDGHRDNWVNEAGERVKKIQCPHCAEFDAIHERWHYAYNGGQRWGYSGIDKQKGYKLYVEMMERFDNDVDAWQEAYITDFRARRDYLKADREWVQRNRVPFYDGITIDSEGYAPRIRQQGPSPAKLRRHEREVERIKKRIEKYLDGYIKALVKGMPMPAQSDCWFCALRNESGTMGDITGNTEHLLSHMEERYYVPSLVTNAMQEGGKYTDIGIYMWLDMNQDNHTMGGKPQGNKPYDVAKRAMRKYMQKRLVPEPPTS